MTFHLKPVHILYVNLVFEGALVFDHTALLEAAQNLHVREDLLLRDLGLGACERFLVALVH